MKVTLTFLFFFMLFNSFAQEEVLSMDNTLKERSFRSRNIVPITNKLSDEFSLLFIEQKKIYAFLYNDDFTLKDSLISSTKKGKYKTIIGNSISKNNDYRIYLANDKKNKIISLNLSFKNKTSSVKELEIDLRKEKFVQTVNYQNKFYLITIKKNTSVLNIYTFGEKGDLIKNVIDLSNYKFVNYNNISPLYSLLAEHDSGFSKMISINKFQYDTPSSIEKTSDYTKLYIRGANIVFTFDQNKTLTQILTIDLESLKPKLKSIKKPFLQETEFYNKKTNSFINEDKIYQLVTTSKDFIFTVKDLKSEEVIKTYKLNYLDSITFKNSPIIQEKSNAFSGTRKMEKTKKYLRKIAASNIGITVFKNKRNYAITLGGKKEIKQGGMMMPGFGGIPLGSFGAATIFFNPTYLAYNSYSNTKSTFINCLFDDKMNHVEGKIDRNIFDIIKLYEEKQHLPEIGETIFKYEDYYILGHYYFNKDKKYHLRKFSTN